MPVKSFSNFNLNLILNKPLDEIDNIIQNKEQQINKIIIPKKDGSPRNIIAPGKDLKYIQKSIYWKLLKRYKAHDAAHGFVSGRGISTNADVHVGANSICKIDISNFFDSISINHLKNCLFGNKHICRYCVNYERMLDGLCHPSLYKNKAENFKYKCEEMKAVFIPNYCQDTGYESLFNRVFELCTYNGFAAQGFPTSPTIANIVMRGFDNKINEYCDKNGGVSYSRYADDLCFSSKYLNKDDLKKIVLKKAYRLLWAFGFEANKKKTILKNRTGRLKVCGVIVNEKKNIQKSQIRLFRAKVHNFTIKFPERATKKRLRELKGYASFVMGVNRDKGKYYMDKLLVFEKVKFK